MWNVLTKFFLTAGIHLGSTARSPIDCPHLLTETHVQGILVGPMLISEHQFGGPLAHLCSGQLSLWVSVAWSCPHFLITHPSLHLDSSYIQCSAVGVCFCFHQLEDEGSMMADKLHINLIIRKGHLSLPFLCCSDC